MTEQEIIELVSSRKHFLILVEFYAVEVLT
jgi:hypothetical protein